ncbi:MAG: hypothetical protein O9284_04700 [Steroidobacteraceae bacterium]|jgi:hypothetical protein|nr:hypothetical protein [Steroidobacteraceae bacterium]
MQTNSHDALQRAVDSYAQTFGHDVPVSVIAMFAARPGVLVAEIQQAVRRTSPVPGWRDHAKRTQETAQVR